MRKLFRTLMNLCLGWSLQELSASEQQRQNAIQTLLDCEEEFLSQTRYGVNRYATPLRGERVLSPAQHDVIFQNIEQVKHEMCSVSADTCMSRRLYSS